MSAFLRATAEVDLDAIRASVGALDRASGDAAVMAVVKADGYGHGMLPSARAALDGGATWLGVAFVEEALALRAAGIEAPVLSLVSIPDEDLGPAVAADVDLPVGSLWSLDQVAAAVTTTGKTARVHLKIDTGLARGGATAADWPALVEAAAKRAADGMIEIVGIWSHLVHADAPFHPTTDAQVAAFVDALAAAEGRGVVPQVRHLASSGATLVRPDSHFDLVRPGIAVYGLSPLPRGEDSHGLVPAMTVRAKVALVKRVPAGTGVSYGHRYSTQGETTLALIPMGYADGIPRAASNAASVLVGGTQRTIAGTVCMDQLVVDCGDDAVSVGDEVVLMGRADRGEPSVDDWAAATDTINYELVTRIGARVPRSYVGERP